MSQSFSNQAVDFDELPQLEDDQFTSVELAYFWLRLVTVVGGEVVLLAAVVAGLWVTDFRLSLTQQVGLGSVLVFGVLAAVVCLRLEVGRMGYLLREHDCSFRSGVLRTSVATIPFSRVQNVAIDRSLLARVFGLANLRLHSAGGALHIVGITYGSAERLKSHIVDQARIAADQEQAAR